MTFRELEAIDHGHIHYNLRSKLWEHILKRSELCFAKNAAAREEIRTVEALETYAAAMRERFIARLGGIPYDSALPLQAEVTGVIEEPGLRIENIVYQSRPNVHVTANLYLPEKRKTPCGAVLLQMGHAENGKFYDIYQKVARSVASAGVIVFAIDPMGQGERLSYFEKGSAGPAVEGNTTEHQYTGDRCVLLGDGLARYFISDAMRAVDYLLTRPEVDGSKIGATGCSGGGTATAHLMVCDPRIAAAAPAAFLTNRREYLYSGNPQDSEQIWLGATADGFDHHEVLACFAPKPTLVLTCDSDFFCVEGTDDLMAVCSRFWALFGKENALQRFRDDTVHGYSMPLAAAAAAFFARVLNGEKRQTDPQAIRSIDEKLLWATSKGQVVFSYPDAKTVFEENQERLQAVRCTEGAADFIRERMDFMRQRVPLRLRKIIPATTAEGLKLQPLMWFSQPQMPQQGLLFTQYPAFTEIVLCLWDKGTDDLESHKEIIQNICQTGKAALVVDLSGMGKCKPYELNTLFPATERFGVLDVLTKDLYCLDDSLCALRLYELHYALEEICGYFRCKGSLYAEGLSCRYAQLMQLVKPELDIRIAKDGTTYADILGKKYYCDHNLSAIILPGIGKYIL